MSISSESTKPVSLRVLSLNCWGLKFVAHKRKERLQAIAEWISLQSSRQRPAEHSSSSSYHSEDELESLEGNEASGWDVIALQEIWVKSDFDLVVSKAKGVGMKYSRFFYSGAIGSGLGIISRYPIVSSFIHPYQLNGQPLHFIEGDFFAGKSVCGCTIDVSSNENQVALIDVLNTHMFAPGGEGDSVEGSHRLAQAWELIKIVNEKIDRGRHVVLTGDFNSQPHSIIMRIISTASSLSDAWALTNEAPPSITSSAHRALTPVQTMLTHGITCDSPLNTYSAAKLAKRSPRDDTRIRGGKRLDYVLFRSPVGSSHTINVESTKIVLTDPVPGLGVSYSDHFALSATLSFQPNPNRAPVAEPEFRISDQDLSTMLSNFTVAYRKSVEYQSNQFKLFLLALVLVPALSIAASFQPLRGALGWLIVVLGIANGAGGATMLYTGFVGGNWERGSLRNFIAEVETEIEERRRSERDELR